MSLYAACFSSSMIRCAWMRYRSQNEWAGGVAQQISRQYELKVKLGTSDQGTHLQFLHDDGLVIRQRNHVLLRKPTRDVPDVSSVTNVNTHKSQPDDGEHHFHIRRPRPDIGGRGDAREHYLARVREMW